MNNQVYKKVLEFKHRHPATVAWRLKQNSSVIEKHLNPDEEVLYAFAAQKNDSSFDIFGTAVIAITNKRILIGSTSKMGAGTNCQNKIIALHHLDCPWRPADLTQRNR